jgi:hopanoid-associated phosphorylase
LRSDPEQNDEPVIGRATNQGAQLIVVTGLKAEARIAAAGGVTVFPCGGNVGLQAQGIRQAVFSGAAAIVSFGIAGGLAPHLQTGDWVVANGVVSGDRYIETDSVWSNRLAQRLSAVALGDIATVAVPALDPMKKRRLHLETGAVAVDMESFQAAALARELGVPFAAVRVVADPAHRTIPFAARLALQSNGAVAIAPILHSLLRKPSQLPALFRVASDAIIAFGALYAGRQELGPRFALALHPTALTNEPVNSAELDRQRVEPLPA